MGGEDRREKGGILGSRGGDRRREEGMGGERGRIGGERQWNWRRETVGLKER